MSRECRTRNVKPPGPFQVGHAGSSAVGKRRRRIRACFIGGCDLDRCSDKKVDNRASLRRRIGLDL